MVGLGVYRGKRKRKEVQKKGKKREFFLEQCYKEREGKEKRLTKQQYMKINCEIIGKGEQITVIKV